MGKQIQVFGRQRVVGHKDSLHYYISFVEATGCNTEQSSTAQSQMSHGIIE